MLVATDIASKGLDFENIQHVINYDMPGDIENYGVCLYMCVSVCLSVHVCIYVCVHVCICLHACVCVCVYMCVYCTWYTFMCTHACVLLHITNVWLTRHTSVTVMTYNSSDKLNDIVLL